MVSSVDVAKLAGVSQATVSRVLNNPGKVNAETLEKVNAAIRQLNYRPNAAARSLVGNRSSGKVAFVCGPLTDPETADAAGRTILYLQSKGYTSELHIQDAEKPGKVFDLLSQTQAEGIVLGPVRITREEMQLLESSGVPYVFCGQDDLAAGSSVSMDNVAAGRLAAEYICLREHRFIGWIGGSEADQRLLDRYQGFMEEAKANGAEVIAAMGEISDYDAVMSAMMARKDRPSALVAATDELGARAIDFLLAYGYSIPEDIHVAGIGNSRQSSMNYLQLTSIGLSEDVDIYKEAADRLLVKIAGEFREKIGSILLQPELYQRKSTGSIE